MCSGEELEKGVYDISDKPQGGRRWTLSHAAVKRRYVQQRLRNFDVGFIEEISE